MNKFEISEYINDIVAPMDARMTGNEQNPIVARRLKSLVESERLAVVGLLRDWLAARPKSSNADQDHTYGKKVSALNLALEIAAQYSLVELRPDIEALIADIRLGKAYLPYYAEMVEKDLQRIG